MAWFSSRSPPLSSASGASCKPTCLAWGDPHYIGFDGGEYDFHGLGVHTMASWQGPDGRTGHVQTYHCPVICGDDIGSTDWFPCGASSAVAMLATAPDGHTILVAGDMVYVDGEQLATPLASGEYREFVPGILKGARLIDNDPDYKTPGMKLRIKTGDAVEVSTWNWDTVHMPTGYLTNVRVQLPGGIAPEDGLCTAPTTSPLDECKAKCDAEPTYAKVTKGVSCEQAGYHTIWDGPRCEAGTRALGLWDPTMKYTGTHFLPWHRGFVASPPGCNARINPLEEHSVFVNTDERPKYDTGPIGVAECSPNYPCICDTGAHPRLCTPRAPFEGCTTFEVCDPAVDCGCTPNGDGSIISATATTNSCQQRHDEGYMPPLEYCKCVDPVGVFFPCNDDDTFNGGLGCDASGRRRLAFDHHDGTWAADRPVYNDGVLVEGVVAGGYPSCAEQCEVSFGGSPRVSSMPIATPTAVPLGGWVTTVLSRALRQVPGAEQVRDGVVHGRPVRRRRGPPPDWRRLLRLPRRHVRERGVHDGRVLGRDGPARDWRRVLRVPAAAPRLRAGELGGGGVRAHVDRPRTREGDVPVALPAGDGHVGAARALRLRLLRRRLGRVGRRARGRDEHRRRLT